MSSPLAGRTIVLAVTGSIAAYKAAALARLLVGVDARVIPVLTASASRFVGAATFAGITGEPVREQMFDSGVAGELHVELASQADVVLVVPATADVLARFASGRADDLVTALVLCAKGPVLAAPAMHPRMWAHPATQANVKRLEEQGRVRLIGPTHGPVASGDEGWGRMAEPREILTATEALFTKQDLAGLRVIVTAGPTHEALDPVRYVGNRSSGIMGFRLAERAAARGARVTLIAGPVALATPAGGAAGPIGRIDVTDARGMQAALAAALGEGLTGADALVMAAAVADYRPKEPSAKKIKRVGKAPVLALELVANADLLAEVGAARAARGGSRPVLVGFALETEQGAALVAHAREKLARKKVDLIVANTASVALGGEDSHASLVTSSKARDLGPMSKRGIADEIWDFVRGRVETRRA